MGVNLVQIGIRSSSKDEEDYVKSTYNIQTFKNKDVHKHMDAIEYYLVNIDGPIYISIDMDVVNEEGEELGVLYDVMQTGANDVFVVKLKDTGKELLLPNIPSCVLNVDIESRKITVHVLDGLMDM